MWSIWNWQDSSHVTNLKINRIIYVKKKKLHEQDRATYVISLSQLVTSRGHWICFNHSLGTAALLGKVIRMSEKIRGSPGIFKSFRFITISSDTFITKGNQNKWNGCAKRPVKSVSEDSDNFTHNYTYLRLAFSPKWVCSCISCNHPYMNCYHFHSSAYLVSNFCRRWTSPESTVWTVFLFLNSVRMSWICRLLHSIL